MLNSTAALHRAHHAPLLSPVVWTAIKLSQSYSCLTVDEAHLQEQTALPLSLSMVRTLMELRGPSLMRNSWVEISSIPFGADIHPKALDLLHFSIRGKEQRNAFIQNKCLRGTNSCNFKLKDFYSRRGKSKTTRPKKEPRWQHKVASLKSFWSLEMNVSVLTGPEP